MNSTKGPSSTPGWGLFSSSSLQEGIAGKESPLTSGDQPKPLRKKGGLGFPTAGAVSSNGSLMLTDAAILLLVFAAGYGLRAWISARRRRAIRKARGGV